MSGNIRIAVLCLIIANIIWGASFPIYKWSLEAVPPFTFVFLRFFLGALLLLPFTLKKLHIQKKDLWKLFHISFVGITLTISFLFLGLQYSSSINAPIVMSSGPIFLIIAAALFLHEIPKRKVVIGTLISLIGVLFIILHPVLEQGFNMSLLGNVFLLLATLGSVSHTLLLKKILNDYHPLTITFWSFMLGSLPLLPLVFWENTPETVMSMFSFQGLTGIFYGVVFASAIAHVLTAIGIKYIAANEVGIFSYVDPIATVIVALPLLGEKITPVYLFSGLLIFLGIFIAENRLHWHPLHLISNKRS